MIPKRQGLAGIGASIPTGNGQLPPVPAAPEGGPVLVPNSGPAELTGTVAPSVETVVVPANSANAILDALQKFTTVRKKTAVTDQTLQMLKGKGLIYTVGDHVIISEKGLTYLIDFNLIA